MKKPLSFALACLLALTVCVTSVPALAAPEADAYYYAQLTTDDARAIYQALETMAADGTLLTGTQSVDLVQAGLLENKPYDRDMLTADFISARDAFLLDHDLFYVDFDKLTLSVTQTGDQLSVTLGTGRDVTWLREGFTSAAAQLAVTDFDNMVHDIALAAADTCETLEEQVRFVYDRLLDITEYALEADAAPENVPFVRTSYGALVRGQAVCEGYARTLKALLDQLGVENVLVQGVYDDGTYTGPHMWNYVRMDDNRWYFLDATMEDGLRDSTGMDDSAGFFLLGGLSEGMENYQPDGIISLSPLSFSFVYPDLSAWDYQPLSQAFEVVKEDWVNDISYRGMGVAQARAQGKYILCSHNGAAWYYWENLMKVTVGQNPAEIPFIDLVEMGFDRDGSFTDLTSAAYFAVTHIPAPTQFPDSNTPSFYSYVGGQENLYDQTKLSDPIDFSKTPPYVAQRLPYSSRLEQDQTYEITVIYSEDLMRTNTAQEPTLEWVREIEGASFSDFQWDGQRTVTFSLTTATRFGRSTNYYLQPEGLMGVSSRRAPNAIYFSTYNNNVFACPKVPGDVNRIHAETPALVTNSDLSENSWLDENGSPIGNFSANRLALVATRLTGEDADQLLDQVEDPILASQTFDISLSLCSTQVDYITGKKLQVFLPYPEGYTSQSNAAFKAYHLTKEGVVEEIDCVPVEGGIIMLCDSFSPFALVATEKTAHNDRKVLLSVSAGGKLDVQGDLLTLEEGQSRTITLTAEEGFYAHRALLDGRELPITDGQITLTHADLQEAGSLLEITFLALPQTEPACGHQLVRCYEAAGLTVRHCLVCDEAFSDEACVWPLADAPALPVGADLTVLVTSTAEDAILAAYDENGRMLTLQADELEEGAAALTLSTRDAYKVLLFLTRNGAAVGTPAAIPLN